MSRKTRNQPKGITLILAIMIMSAIVAIGTTLSTVLVFQVRINKVVKEGHQGYYATESGLELGLNKINTLKSGTLAAAITSLTGAALPEGADGEYVKYFCPTGTCACKNGTCAGSSLLASSVAATSAVAVPPLLKENQSVIIELYNVDSSTSSIGLTPTLCVFAEGVDTDGAGADSDGNEILEVSWVAWDTSLKLSRTQKIFVSETNFSGSSCSAPLGTVGFPVPLTQFYPHFAPTGNYAGFRIRITPLAVSFSPPLPGSGDVKNMKVTTDPEVTSHIQLKSVSDANGQKQALVALFPWSLPLSSLLDFAIFSDKSLEKNKPITIAQDLRRYGPFAATNGTIPTTPTNAFDFSDPADPDCSSVTSCAYYVRLIDNGVLPKGWPETGATVNITSTNSTNSAQTFNALNATSCILREPFIVKDKINVSIVFSSKPPKLAQYELLTRPAFSTSDENYCPGL